MMKGVNGIPNATSVKRMMIVSVFPPKYPEIRPTRVPITTVASAAEKPT